MSTGASTGQLRQPMVVVAALLFSGILAGWWLLSSGFVGALMLFAGAVGAVLALGVAWLFWDRGALLVAMLFGCGVAVVSLSTHRSGDIYERSSLAYFVGERQSVAESRGYVDYRYAAPRTWGQRANVWCYERLELLGLESQDMALLSAMLLGRRGAIDGELRAVYARSGSAHLLAISGLHLGVILVLANFLFSFLNLFWRGNVWRNLFVLAAVWGYVCVVGASASVVRAGVMFSVLQLALFMARGYSSVSGLAAAVVAMALFDPKVLFDVGFLLSFSAVGAILLWGLPLWGVASWELRGFFRRFDSFGVVGFLVLSLIIGLVCSVATAPLVGYAFGYVAFWGVLLSPLVTISVGVALGLGVVWILFGFGAVAPLFRWCLELVLGVQNCAVGFMASGWRDAVDVDFRGVWVVVAYLAYSVITLLFWGWLEGYYERRSVQWYDAIELPWHTNRPSWDDI